MPGTKRLRGPLTRLIVRGLVRDWTHPERADVAVRLGLLALGLSVLVNAILFGLKMGFGFAIGSLALIGDALDTLGDVLLDIVGLVALRVSQAGPDPEHPYGHERAEEIATVALATVLFVIGLQLGFQSGRRFVVGDFEGRYSAWAVGAALASVLGKLFLSGFSGRVAEYTGSGLLKASAWHNATDVASGLLAAVAIYARSYGYGWADPAAAALIALLILYVSVHLFREASMGLLGRGASPEHQEQIHRVACGQPGVLGCSDIEMHWYGRKRRVSMRILVSAALSLSEADQVAHRVQEALHGLHADWEPVVHVEPVPVPERGAGAP